MALTDGLLSWWPLDESSGASRADSVGGRTLSDIGTVDAAAGKIGNAASFSGGDYLRKTPQLSGLEGLGAASFSCWVYRTAGGVFWLWAALNNSSGGVCYLLGVNANLRMYVGGDYGEMASAMPLNTWAHIVFVFDGSQSGNSGRLVGYLDGVAQTLSYSGTIGTAFPPVDGGGSSAVMIGSLSGGSYYTGLVDLFGYWNRALSSAEVSQLYNAGAGFDYPFIAAGKGLPVIAHHHAQVFGAGA